MEKDGGGGGGMICTVVEAAKVMPYQLLPAGAAQLILLEFVLSHEMDLAFEDMHDQS
jgi:hypothetical protein